MNSNNRFYKLIKKIHLYASLTTVAVFLMYLITSYMMIYHDWFSLSEKQEQTQSIEVATEEISEEKWPAFLKKHDITGRLIREQFRESGDLFREYAGAGHNFKLTISKTQNKVEIKATHSNLAGNIVGLHRLRGYGGPLHYNLYALLLDLVGIGLIVFAITGVILWLKLLKNNKLAWTILILGFVYVSFVVGYLLYV